jgi:hypothetical protein
MITRGLVAAGAALALCAVPAAAAAQDEGHGSGARGGYSLAVYGDAPYGTTPDRHR